MIDWAMRRHRYSVAKGLDRRGAGNVTDTLSPRGWTGEGRGTSPIHPRRGNGTGGRHKCILEHSDFKSGPHRRDIYLGGGQGRANREKGNM
eukprot:358200-Chlamydomonas_euryale.AAC.4